MDYRQIVRDEARRVGVDPNIAEAVMSQESGGNPRAVSPKGAQGLLQLMPATAKELGVDPADPQQNIRGGVQYLKQQIDRYGTAGGLAAYNAGPGRVGKTDNFADLPAETRAYVPAVLNRAAMIAEKSQDAPAQAGSGPNLDALMRGYDKAQAAGDRAAAQELGSAIQSKLSGAVQKAQAAGDTAAVEELQGVLGRFGGQGATQAPPAADKSTVDALKTLSGAPAAPAKAAASPAKAPEAPKEEPSTLAKIGRGVDDFVRGAADTITFGFADEIAAKLNSVTGGKSYDQELKAERARDQEGGGARVAGQLAGGLLPSGIAARGVNSASRLARVGAGAATGGAQGALYGFGSAEGDLGQRLVEGAKTGAIGLAAGGALGAVLPASVKQVATGIMQKAGSKEAAAIDAEIIKKIGEVAQNPNFRGQPIRAQQLNDIGNTFIREANEGIKAVGAKELGEQAKPLRDSLLRWKSIQADEIDALRTSDVGSAVADSIVKAQRVRSLTAEQEAAGGVRKALRSVNDVFPQPQATRLAFRALLGGEQSRKAVTRDLISEKNLKAADAVLERVGPSQAGKASETLQDLIAQAQTRAQAEAAAKVAQKAQGRASRAAAKDPAKEAQIAIAEQQAKDPSFLLGLGNQLGAPRNADQMAEFSKVLKNQMEAREAQRQLQSAAAKAAKGPAPSPRNEVLSATRAPLSGAFQELLKGGRSNLNMTTDEAIDALRLVSRGQKDNPVGQAAQQILKSNNVADETAFYGLQNLLRRYQEGGAVKGAGAGVLAQGPTAAQGVLSSKAATYQEAVRTAGAAADLARKAAPNDELAMLATRVAATKNRGEKSALLEEALKSASPAEAAYLKKFVAPLTEFGKR